MIQSGYAPGIARMQPYRTQPDQPLRVTFGDERRSPMLFVGTLLLVVLPIALFVLWIQSGGGVAILFIPMGGLLLLLRRRGGSIEYLRDQGELLVTSRALLASHEDRVPASDVTGLVIMHGGPRRAPQLQLRLKGDAAIPLLGSPDEAELEAARATVRGFLEEHRLLPVEAPGTLRAHLGEDGPEEDPDQDHRLDARESDQHR